MCTLCFKSLTKTYWFLTTFTLFFFIFFFCVFEVPIPEIGENNVYIGLIHPVLVPQFSFWQALLIVLIIFAIVIYSIKLCLEFLALKKLKKLTLILYDECNPQQYCIEINHILDYLSQKNRLCAKRCRECYGEIKLTPAYAYCFIDSGEISKGVAMLETYLNTTMKHCIKSLSPPTVTDAQLVLLGYYCSTQQFEKAQTMQHSLLQTLEKYNTYFSSKGELATYYRTAAEALIAVPTGNVQTAISSLSALQCHCRFPWQKIQLENYISHLETV